MLRLTVGSLFLVAFAAAPALSGRIVEYKSGIPWQPPKVVDPGPAGGPPSDAIVLFGGKDLSKWEGGDKWLVRDGVATAQHQAIKTRQSFGDCQLHLEWASPEKVVSTGQGRGNSGAFLMDRYEVQILDCYQNETYFDGQAASVYKQRPPLVNACRKPGQWQTYDIVFHGPRFDAKGRVLKPATITLLHNGVLVQDHFELLGDTSYIRPPLYLPHPAKAPISLQFHGNPVRFRNIWLRELTEFHVPPKPAQCKAAPAAAPVCPPKPVCPQKPAKCGR
jgi:hypothetical protein